MTESVIFVICEESKPINKILFGGIKIFRTGATEEQNKEEEREWPLQQEARSEHLLSHQRAIDNANRALIGMSRCRKEMEGSEPGSTEYKMALEEYKNFQTMKVNAEFTLNGGFPSKCT